MRITSDSMFLCGCCAVLLLWLGEWQSPSVSCVLNNDSKAIIMSSSLSVSEKKYEYYKIDTASSISHFVVRRNTCRLVFAVENYERLYYRAASLMSER